MDELLAQFVVEARELTQQAVDDLIALEPEPRDRARLESAFRAMHTLKGSVGLFPFEPLQRTLHAAEDVLSAAIAAGEMDPDLVDPLVAIIEWTDRCVSHVALTGVLPDTSVAEAHDLVRPLARASQHERTEPAEAALGNPEWAKHLFDSHPEALAAVRYTPDPECFFNGDDPLALVARVPSLTSLSVSPRESWPPLEHFDPFRCNLIIELTSAAPLAEVEPIFRLIPDQAMAVARMAVQPTVSNLRPQAGGQARAGASFRVDAARIDGLLDIVGELYTARDGLSRLSQLARANRTDPLVARQAAGALQQFDRLLAQLREGVMAVRMVPLEQTFRRLPRVVREIAQQTGKKVNIEISGDDIEADRSIVEGLFEPLLHLIRNAIDHGLELTDDRVSVGKPATGTLSISAQGLGAQISITVRDDGRGIDLDRVRQVALRRGLIDEGRASLLQRDEILELLFAPGFSTSTTVTELSGRGVGMDAVRAAVRALGGSASIATEPGRGTTFDLMIPVSFSMSRLLTVAIGGEWYGIPLATVAETARIAADSIFPVRAGRAFVLRDRTVPFLALGDILDIASASEDDNLVLVVNTATGPVGLGVDAIGDRAEIMVRPLNGLLKAAVGFLGTTVLGDGRVLMILDVDGLIG